MDELDLIARLPASREDSDPTEWASKARARARVMGTIAASAEAGPNGTARRHHHASRHARRSSTPRILRYGVAAAVAAITAALIVPVLVPDRLGSSASAALLELGESAGAARGWESPTQNQFIYTRSSGQSPLCEGNSCVLETFQRESWVAPDGSGRIVETRGDQSSDEQFEPGELAYRDLDETLGWSQMRIRRHIEGLAGIEDADDFTTFVVIGQLMGENQLLPETRKSLFMIAATLRDTELLGSRTDHVGRSGIGIGYSSEGLRYEIIYDEQTALVLEERVAQLAAGSQPVANAAVPGGWLVAGGRSTYALSGLVASVNEQLQ